MAKKSYIGINGTARKIKKWYIGVNGTARKVKKAYIGVNGIARQFYSSDSYRWDRYSVVSGGGLKLLRTFRETDRYGRPPRTSRFYASNNDYAYCGEFSSYSSAKNKLESLVDFGSTKGFEIDRLNRKGDRDSVDLNSYIIFSPFNYTEYNDSSSSLGGDRDYYPNKSLWTIKASSKSYPEFASITWIDSSETAVEEVYGIDSQPSKGSYIDTVESENPNAYPSNGVFNGYWYVRR